MSDHESDDIAELIRLANKHQWANGDERRRLERAGVRLSRADFYSETPSLDDIEGSFEYADGTSAEPVPVFDDPDIFDLPSISAFAATLPHFSRDFAPPIEAETGFFWRNDQFSYSDAMSLYAIVRSTRPSTILEIGSGFSSMVSARALADNDFGKLICIDPSPRTDISRIGAEFIQRPVQSVAPRDIVNLVRPGDVVFYDGSHPIKTGSDAVYFYLKVLPMLPSGVLVHCHDIRLPYAQPVNHLIEHKLNWSEQYLLMAHLHNKHRYRVIFGSTLLDRQFPEVLDQLMHRRWPRGGASIWFTTQ